MNELNFNSIFANAIVEGIKTSTIRRHFDSKEGDSIIARENPKNFISRGKIIGQLHIKDIRRIRFDEIDKEISRTEGFLHEDLLKDTLYDFYDDLEESTLLYYILFEYSNIKSCNNCAHMFYHDDEIRDMDCSNANALPRIHDVPEECSSEPNNCPFWFERKVW